MEWSKLVAEPEGWARGKALWHPSLPNLMPCFSFLRFRAMSWPSEVSQDSCSCPGLLDLFKLSSELRHWFQAWPFWLWNRKKDWVCVASTVPATVRCRGSFSSLPFPSLPHLIFFPSFSSSVCVLCICMFETCECRYAFFCTCVEIRG